MDVGGVPAVLRLGEDVQRTVEVTAVSTLSSVVAPVAPIDDDATFPRSGFDVVPATNTSSLVNLLQKENFRLLRKLEGNTIDKVIGVGVVRGDGDNLQSSTRETVAVIGQRLSFDEKPCPGDRRGSVE